MMRWQNYFKITPNIPADAEDLYVAVVNGANAVDLKSFYNEVARAFMAPDTPSGDHESFKSSLSDLRWITKRRCILYLKSYPELLSREENNVKLDALIKLVDWCFDAIHVKRKNRLERKREFKIYIEPCPEVTTPLREPPIPDEAEVVTLPTQL